MFNHPENDFMKIFLDFDGTVVEHYYPLIGAYNLGCIEVLCMLQEKGFEIILNTYRSEIEDDSLQQAIAYLNDLPLLDKITKSTSHKVSPVEWNVKQALQSNQLFIDDIAPGIPLTDAPKSGGKMVDWHKVYQDLVSEGILE